MCSHKSATWIGVSDFQPVVYPRVGQASCMLLLRHLVPLTLELVSHLLACDHHLRLLGWRDIRTRTLGHNRVSCGDTAELHQARMSHRFCATQWGEVGSSCVSRKKETWGWRHDRTRAPGIKMDREAQREAQSIGSAPLSLMDRAQRAEISLTGSVKSQPWAGLIHSSAGPQESTVEPRTWSNLPCHLPLYLLAVTKFYWPLLVDVCILEDQDQLSHFCDAWGVGPLKLFTWMAIFFP